MGVRIESELQTERDMELERNVAEATWRLDACQSANDFMTWAKSYGHPLLNRCRDRVSVDMQSRTGGISRI